MISFQERNSVIPFPNIDPILLHLGPLAIRWYSLAYVVGLLVGWRYVIWLAKRPPKAATMSEIDDFLTWAVLGVILGGRTGYVLFYKFDYYMSNPVEIFMVWHGGMSFHGGLLGVTVAGLWFVRRRGIKLLPFADIVVCAVPIGLFLGRIANFINGELYGRITDVPWAVIFPKGGPYPRHPSQFYEAGLEGIVLFILLHFLWRWKAVRDRPGILSGVFLTGYAAARMTAEMFRQPDANIGFLIDGTTMGQWLSMPMLAAGLILIGFAIWSGLESRKHAQ